MIRQIFQNLFGTPNSRMHRFQLGPLLKFSKYWKSWFCLKCVQLVSLNGMATVLKWKVSAQVKRWGRAVPDCTLSYLQSLSWAGTSDWKDCTGDQGINFVTIDCRPNILNDCSMTTTVVYSFVLTPRRRKMTDKSKNGCNTHTAFTQTYVMNIKNLTKFNVGQIIKLTTTGAFKLLCHNFTYM